MTGPPVLPTGIVGRSSVSVVVPVYNGGKHLRQCLASILAQTRPLLEIIVMDDASTDDTADVARAFGEAISYVRQPENRGQFRNVEDGIALARGEYVAVFHADDVYDATIVAEEAALLDADQSVGLVFALDRFIDGEGREYGKLAIPLALRRSGPFEFARLINAVLEYKNVFMPTPSAMARTSLYREVGAFTTEFGSAGDLDMWLRLARRTRIAVLEQHLFSYRHTASSEGQSYQRLRTVPENYFALMVRHLAECPDVVVQRSARRGFEAHRAVDALRITVNAYLLGDGSLARANWRRARLAALIASHRIDRVRHVVLWTALFFLCRLPRSNVVVRLLHWRYYGRLPWWRSNT